MSEDMDDPDIKAGLISHELLACVYELGNMVHHGHGRWIDESKLIMARGQLEGLLDYMRQHRQANAA